MPGPVLHLGLPAASGDPWLYYCSAIDGVMPCPATTKIPGGALAIYFFCSIQSWQYPELAGGTSPPGWLLKVCPILFCILSHCCT